MARKLLHKLVHANSCQSGEPIRRAIEGRCGISVTVGVGDPVYALEEVARSYARASERCRYRLFFGPGQVIDEPLVRPRLSAFAPYPAAIEQRIVGALKRGDAGLIETSVGLFIDAMAPLSYYQVITCSGRLLLAIFWHFAESTELLDENHKEYDTLLHRIETAESMRELREQIVSFCTAVSALISEGTNRTHVKRNERIVAEVKTALSARYAEPGMSIEIVADLVGLSPGYLAKLFKLVTGQSFADHVNGVRLEKARELLATTSISAQAIGEMVGIYNATYFSTLFKKAYGLSPSRYRDRAIAS